MEFKTSGVMEKNLIDDLKRQGDLVKEEKDYYVFTDPKMKGFTYDIEKSRCKNDEEFIQWIYHMSEKAWVTTEHINMFITRYAGGNIYNRSKKEM